MANFFQNHLALFVESCDYKLSSHVYNIDNETTHQLSLEENQKLFQTTNERSESDTQVSALSRHRLK